MKYRFQHREDVVEVQLERTGSSYRAVINGISILFEILDYEPGMLSVKLEGKNSTIAYAANEAGIWISLDGCAYLLKKPASRRSRHSGDASGGQEIRAPMPAQVTAVQVIQGDPVEKGQLLMLLEAMKMEIRIKAPESGFLSHLAVKTGQTVEREQLLARVDPGNLMG